MGTGGLRGPYFLCFPLSTFSDAFCGVLQNIALMCVMLSRMWGPEICWALFILTVYPLVNPAVELLIIGPCWGWRQEFLSREIQKGGSAWPLDRRHPGATPWQSDRICTITTSATGRRWVVRNLPPVAAPGSVWQGDHSSWKVMENSQGHGKSWKIMANDDDVLEFFL